jgi:hypothetical protein
MDLCLKIKGEAFRVGEFAPDIPGRLMLEDLEEFLSIVSGDKHKFLSTASKKMVAAITHDRRLWPLLLKSTQRQRIVSEALKAMNCVLEDENALEYFKVWHKIRAFLSSLSPVRVDTVRWRTMREKFTTLRGITFNSHAITGLLSKTVYSTSSTSTGRLTIVEGPNFLVSPAESRSAIIPTTSEGRIVSVDFISMEPRVALLCAEDSNDFGDVYTHLMSMCEIGSRSAAKLATISALYGASQAKLIETMGSRAKAKSIIENVRRFFCVEKLEISLAHQASRGVVRNLFGRPLRDATAQPRVRVNHFVQSTAADLAVLLFSELCAKFDRVRPLLVIHDALIVEVPDSVMGEFEEACRTILCGGVSFPTTVDTL